ncbi:MAG: alpha/beta hydrolase [Novosphingobium sp.]|nr:alpha/beta hydrolase [Novosphingobium sp.]
MPRIEILGLGIEYDLLGEPNAPAIALTPGGRFPMDTPGMPELAKELAAGGKRVLLWDRPNCGASDVTFDAEYESELQGRTLTKLIRALDLGPTAIAAGSGGSRVSLIAASRDPDIVSHLIVWWISGGLTGLLTTGTGYSCNSALAASWGGMESVAELPDWADQIERNPQAREAILAQDPDEFIRTMERWTEFFFPSEVSPVPGMTPQDFARLRMPTMVFRSGKSDLSHPRKTSDWVTRMLPQSEYVDPPWGDDEWNTRCTTHLKDGSPLFANWPKLAPQILEFVNR